jgi:adenine-specific DNA-methyltransferase
MSQNFEKLKAKLLELFMLDQPELDFGIYRIMNSKRMEITQFLEEDLLPQVKSAFAQYTSVDKGHLESELAKAVEQAKQLGVDPETTQKVKDIRAKLAESVDLTALENEVYSDLYNFFRRYYKDGDFLSLRRYKEGVYAIPYEGEEVKLYWANHDQYYIKTSEYLRDYAFNLPNGKKVHFKLTEADIEKDNRKADANKERLFVLADENFIAEENGELIIRFLYIPCEKGTSQRDLIAKAMEKIFQSNGVDSWIASLSSKAPTDKNPNRTVLEKHLTDYTARNTFDYFIHKDLGGFLRRELDFYIKNEIMHLDDIESETAPKVEQVISKIKVIRQIAHKIIRFLEQLENFQKKLWLKKKFVVETNYCVTLDRVPQELYPDIIANDAQRIEWVKLFSIDEIKAEKLGDVNYSNPLTVEFLKANPYLVLDTRFFSEEFKHKLLALFDNLEEQLDGLLVHSENFQALNALQERYKERVKCIYIDPPYNAKSSEILYKNTYKHSSWLGLIFDRLLQGKYLLTEDFVHIIAIDEVEQEVLGQITSQIFPENTKICVSIVHNPRGQQGKNVSYIHEFAYMVYPNDSQKYISDVKRDEIDSRTLRDSGTESDRTDAATCFYPFYVKNNEIVSIGEVPEDDFHPSSANIIRDDGIIEIWPVDDNGNEKKWRYSVNSVEKIRSKLSVKKGRESLQIIFNQDMGVMKSLWIDAKYDASEYGTKVLQNILGIEIAAKFSYPKSINTVKESLFVGLNNKNDQIILDYFAGSGTTGHAVINLNREDKGSRKYILVEMGEYFDTVLKPRIQKVIYSTDWKDGKPVNRDTGISHMFKYIRLESYEDCLNNLILSRTKQQNDLLSSNKDFRESYMLGYMLDTEAAGSASLLNINAFEDPFNYKLNIATGSVGETKPVTVDIVETFNYLLGLRVKHMDTIRGYRVIEGYNPNNEKVLIIWRNTKEKSNEDLEKFFIKQKYNTLDMEYDLIYVNGDNNLENLKKDEDTWKVRLIEEEFGRLMFDVQDVQ